MTYTQLLKAIMKPWLTLDDIQEISNCSRSGAVAVLQAVEDKIVKSGKMLPVTKAKIVPTKMVLEMLSLDEDYIFSMAAKEQRIKTN